MMTYGDGHPRSLPERTQPGVYEFRYFGVFQTPTWRNEFSECDENEQVNASGLDCACEHFDFRREQLMREQAKSVQVLSREKQQSPRFWPSFAVCSKH